MLQANTHAPYVCGFELNDTATGARLYGLNGCMVSVVVWPQWLHGLKESQQTKKKTSGGNYVRVFCSHAWRIT